MRVGLNLLYLIPRVVGGTETYSRGLLHALAQEDSDHEYVVYVNRSAQDWPLPDNARFRRVVCNVSGTSRELRYAYEQLDLPRRARLDRLDLLHSLAYVAPVRLPCPSVVTVHDLTFRALPTPWRRRIAMELFVRLSVHASVRVIAVSGFTRDALLRRFAIPAQKVVVIHEGVDAPAAAVNTPAGEPYIVAFGNQFAHKNVERLLQAFDALRARGLPHRLKIIGRLPPGSRWGQPDRCPEAVDVLGYLETKEMQRVLGGARVLAFPSLYEGFGLPVLEGMALGVPVVCSDRSALPEIGGNAVTYCDPENVDSIAESLRVVLTNPAVAVELGRRGVERARGFTWAKTAAETVRVYQECGVRSVNA